jgi:UDP-N-acetylglucosamine 2-epimerase (non-hydrolysing)
MSSTFFRDLGLSSPDIHLGIGSGTHAEQTGKVMMAYEQVLINEQPDLVIVVGDVNSTLAATIAAVKLGKRVAHLEAGLRSFDRSMPEEINRLVTDTLADVLWTPSPDADENLIREGISREKIVRVGNIMIDSLEMLRGKIGKEEAHKEFGFGRRGYGLVTLHRPSNVDNENILRKLCECLRDISEWISLIFPVHPRTRKNLEETDLIGVLEQCPQIKLTDPLSYIRFMSLAFDCRLVITDSGGIQEEATYMGIPCMTIRPNTERPITILQGTNRLCTVDNLKAKVEHVLSSSGEAGKNHTVPELWDGGTAERVVHSVREMQ